MYEKLLIKNTSQMWLFIEGIWSVTKVAELAKPTVFLLVYSVTTCEKRLSSWIFAVNLRLLTCRQEIKTQPLSSERVQSVNTVGKPLCQDPAITQIS